TPLGDARNTLDYSSAPDPDDRKPCGTSRPHSYRISAGAPKSRLPTDGAILGGGQRLRLFFWPRAANRSRSHAIHAGLRAQRTHDLVFCYSVSGRSERQSSPHRTKRSLRRTRCWNLHRGRPLPCRSSEDSPDGDTEDQLLT